MTPQHIFQRSSLRSFLSLAKTTLDSGIKNSTPITFVLGNESADLDSLCSTILFAYLRTYSPLFQSQTVHVPLSNLLRADLALRSELWPVLSRVNINSSDLITLCDLSPSLKRSQTLHPKNTRWILIDHNAMQGELGRLYSSHVTGTIDHHDDEGAVPEDCGGEPRIIRKSGSCASLVVEYCKESWDALSSTVANRDQGVRAKETADITTEWDAEVALLALAPIIFDTTNLMDITKVTKGDVDAVLYLDSKAKLGVAVEGYDRDACFREISEASQDIEGLSFEEILRKDYKQWTEHGSVTLGISAVVKDIDFLVRKVGSRTLFLDKLRRFAEERQLSAVAIMTTSTSKEGKFTRELLVWGVDRRGADTARRFENDAGDSLELEEWGKGAFDQVDGEAEAGWRRCWVQGKVEKSRKQVAPLLRKAVA